MSTKNSKTKNYLAIDYGKSKVGLAVGDSEIAIAFAYKTLDNDEKLMENLRKIIKEREISQIILGELGMPGGQKESFDAQKIGAEMEKELGVEVGYQEEMFSTKMAQNSLKERGMKKIKELDNQEAARIILQSWLDKK
ncbi:MAG TPA: Holliday junction resolvase RuvX [Patescibacteria group bacterium]